MTCIMLLSRHSMFSSSDAASLLRTVNLCNVLHFPFWGLSLCIAFLLLNFHFKLRMHPDSVGLLIYQYIYMNKKFINSEW